MQILQAKHSELVIKNLWSTSKMEFQRQKKTALSSILKVPHNIMEYAKNHREFLNSYLSSAMKGEHKKR